MCATAVSTVLFLIVFHFLSEEISVLGGKFSHFLPAVRVLLETSECVWADLVLRSLTGTKRGRSGSSCCCQNKN